MPAGKTVTRRAHVVKIAGERRTRLTPVLVPGAPACARPRHMLAGERRTRLTPVLVLGAPACARPRHMLAGKPETLSPAKTVLKAAKIFDILGMPSLKQEPCGRGKSTS